VANFGDALGESDMGLPAGTTANTCESCPQGGIWHPVGNASEERAIGIDNKMPPTPKGETHWVLKTPTGDK
jgi:hypothetical protein